MLQENTYLIYAPQFIESLLEEIFPTIGSESLYIHSSKWHDFYGYKNEAATLEPHKVCSQSNHSLKKIAMHIYSKSIDFFNYAHIVKI